MTSPKVVSRISAVLFGLVLSACGSSSDSSAIIAPGGECSIPAQNQAVYNTMQQWYLWYDKLPSLDPTTFESPQALLAALTAPVTDPVDRFSFITTQAEEDALFGDSQFIGFGFRQLTGVDSVTVLDVFEGGPADQGGLDRGSLLLAIDGVPIDVVLNSEGGLSGALGPAEIGYEVEVTFRNQAGEVGVATLVKDTVTIPPVTATQVFQVDGRQTGYLVFRNFVTPGVAALNEAFAEFRDAGVTQLILDLRYNGGGLVSTLEHLANLLGSRAVGETGAVFASYQYNDKNTNRNMDFLFALNPPAAAIDLQQLVVITTPATASASEILINGMAPWVDTATIGRETFGKPVGQLGFRFCEKVLRPVSFQTVNALGEGDFFDGIEPTCAAPDDVAFDFGQAGEASFDAAVHWLRFGFCQPMPETFDLDRLAIGQPGGAYELLHGAN
ncbi:MAG: S41 family peptidase [Gammaproteobacteria bacterium]